MRDSQFGVDQAFEAIHQMDVDNKLTIPLKAFFGRNKNRSGTGKEVNIVVFNRNKDSSLKFKYYSSFRNDEKPESIIVNVDEPTLIYTKVDEIMNQLYNHID